MDIKEDFRKWLIKKGFKEKAVDGHHSSVHEYISKINNICKELNIDWDYLVYNIDDILFYYTVCENNTYYFHGDMCDEGHDFLKIINSFYYKNMNFPYLSFNWSYKDEKHYITNQKELEYLIDNYYNLFVNVGSFIGLLFILNQTSNIKHKKKKLKALEEFYDFIITDKKIVIDSSNNLYSKISKINLSNFNYRNSILTFILDKNSIRKVIELLENTRALKIDIDTLIINDVVSITQSSEKTLRKLNNEGKLCCTKKAILDKNSPRLKYYTYSTQELIDYLKKCFNPIIYSKDFLDYKLNDFSNFYRAELAAQKVGCTPRHIGRLREEGRISYYNIYKKSYRFCPLDIEIIKNEHN